MHVIQNMCNSRLFVLVEVYYLYSIGVFYLYGKEDVMPVTEKKYPDWVQKHRTKGTTVKKRGDSYYLYKRTSRRVKGKKLSAASRYLYRCDYSGRSDTKQ